jgi:glycogen synthase
MTRVALLPSAYRPTLGGVQELTYNLAAALVQGGDDVEVWTQGSSDTAEITIEILDGITVRRFPFPLPSGDFRSWAPFVSKGLRTIRGLHGAVRQFKPDILHVQCFGPNGLYATAISHLSRVPLVVTLQGETVMDDQDIFDHSSTLRFALRAGFRRAAVVTACSAFTLADSESRFGLQRGRGRVIFNGVESDPQPDPDDRAVSDAVRRLGNLPDGYVLGLGRAVDKKGFDLLIRAFALVADRHPAVVLAIGGDGPALDSLRQLVEQLGIQERVKLLGRLSRPDVAEAMAHAKVFVMPSRLEPFGIVVLEGWRAGRPVIASARGGPPEYVTDSKDGLLVDPFDTSDLAKALNRLLSDATLRKSLGEAGHYRVREFSWEEIASAYRRHYAEALRN